MCRRHFSGCMILPMAMALFMPACPNTPVNPPGPDAQDGALIPPPPGGECEAACGSLKLAGCAIGSQNDCAQWLQRDLGNPVAPWPNLVTHKALTCTDIKAVKTRADAIKLGYTCQPIVPN